jgi:hypothetical protein
VVAVVGAALVGSGRAPLAGTLFGSGTPAVVDRLCFAAAALALAGVAAVRAAGWLCALCLIGSGLAGSLAVSRRTGWRGLGADIAALARTSTTWWPQLRPAAGRVQAGRRTIAGLLAGCALVAVFGALLTSADGAFADSVRGVVPELSAGHSAGVALLFVASGSLVVGLVRLITAAPPPTGPVGADPQPPARRLRRYDWAPALAMLDGLFGWFVATQLGTLFGGHRHVLEPGGPDYAQYAYGGFGQLLVVALLTLVVIAVVARHATRDTGTDLALIRVLVGGLCLLTLVILASAADRIALYADAYGFTTARLAGLFACAVLAAVLLLLLVAGVQLRAPWLPRTSAAALLAALLGFALVNPDAVIASTVVRRYEQDGHLDSVYLSGLSVDAVDAVDRLPEPYRSCLLATITAELPDRDPWYALNAGREHARQLLHRSPAYRPSLCTPGDRP